MAVSSTCPAHQRPWVPSQHCKNQNKKTDRKQTKRRIYRLAPSSEDTGEATAWCPAPLALVLVPAVPLGKTAHTHAGTGCRREASVLVGPASPPPPACLGVLDTEPRPLACLACALPLSSTASPPASLMGLSRVLESRKVVTSGPKAGLGGRWLSRHAWGHRTPLATSTAACQPDHKGERGSGARARVPTSQSGRARRAGKAAAGQGRISLPPAPRLHLLPFPSPAPALPDSSPPLRPRL